MSLVRDYSCPYTFILIHVRTHLEQDLSNRNTFIKISRCQIRQTTLCDPFHKSSNCYVLRSIPILLACSLNAFGGNPFVNGSATISSVLMCSIDTRCF
jgi:hypothetical protein